jgi:hypothetical protein
VRPAGGRRHRAQRAPGHPAGAVRGRRRPRAAHAAGRHPALRRHAGRRARRSGQAPRLRAPHRGRGRAPGPGGRQRHGRVAARARHARGAQRPRRPGAGGARGPRARRARAPPRRRHARAARPGGGDRRGRSATPWPACWATSSTTPRSTRATPPIARSPWRSPRSGRPRSTIAVRDRGPGLPAALRRGRFQAVHAAPPATTRRPASASASRCRARWPRAMGGGLLAARGQPRAPSWCCACRRREPGRRLHTVVTPGRCARTRSRPACRRCPWPAPRSSWPSGPAPSPRGSAATARTRDRRPTAATRPGGARTRRG